jgi:hypothetical protein
MGKKVEEARRILGISSKFYEQFTAMAKIMVRKQMVKDTVDSYIAKLLGTKDGEQDSTRKENIKNDILNYIETGKGNTAVNTKGTLWAAVNGVVEYVDWAKRVKGQDEDATKRLESVWYGNGAALKLKAWEEALQIIKN